VNKIILKFNIKISICLYELTLELYTNKTFLIINRISIFLSLDISKERHLKYKRMLIINT